MVGTKDWRKKKFIKILAVAMICILATAALPGCEKSPSGQGQAEPLSVSGFAFDTSYTITLYQGGSQKLLNHCISLCTEYENIFSASDKESELYQVNQAGLLSLEAWQELYPKEKEWNHIRKDDGKREAVDELLQEKLHQNGQEVPKVTVNEDGALEITVSDKLSDIMDRGLHYSKLSKGRFDITIEPVSSLWDFSSGEGKVPGKGKIKEALGYVDYRNVEIHGNTLVLQKPGIRIDLGGIAKGYIADLLKEYLSQNGVTGGIIDLGGNILCIGKKNNGEDFRIGVRQPFADRSETVAVVGICDKSVVSSGVYERYIQAEDGKMYHHILNPQTGYSYENELIGVTIISEKSVDGDGISTSAFALGLKGGLELINSMEETEAVFITEDGKLHYSSGFEKLLQSD